LHTDKAFLARIGTQFEGDFKLHHHLAPPLFSGKNDAGELKKSKFGPWVRVGFHVLAPMKFLRGTALDVFGYTHERREERSLVREYRAAIEGMLPKLTAENRDAAVAFAKVPEQIRGYGHVKARHLKSARKLWEAALQKFHQA
jgi:indolepyruvate ferredoxin oxidoreductase